MPLTFTGKEGEVFIARICTSARDATTEIDTIPQQSRGNGIRKKIYSTLCIPDDKRVRKISILDNIHSKLSYYGLLIGGPVLPRPRVHGTS